MGFRVSGADAVCAVDLGRAPNLRLHMKLESQVPKCPDLPKSLN